MKTANQNCPICNCQIQDNSEMFCPICNWELLILSDSASDEMKNYFNTKLILHKKMYFSQSQENDCLNQGEEIKIGNILKSQNGKYNLIMQEDSNLVLYDSNKVALWSTGTIGKAIEKCIFQHDGNFVLYDENKKSMWHSDTLNKNCNSLILENDGNLAIYSNEMLIWSSGTSEIPLRNLFNLPQCAFQISNKRYNTYIDCCKPENETWKVQNHSDWHGNKNQRWILKRLPNDNQIIFSEESGHCLDTYLNNEKWQLHLWPFHGQNNQQWKIERQKDYSYKIFSTVNDLCLDAWREDGYDILQLWEPHDGEHQNWWLNPIFTN